MPNDPYQHPPHGFDPFHYAQLDRIERKLNWLIQQENKDMATLDDIVADEATLKTANGQLIQLVGNAIAEIAALKGQVNDPATQAKIDALHAALTSDLNDVTTTLTSDGSAVDVPAPAPVPDTGGATGSSS